MQPLEPGDILELWESTWGPLEEQWKEGFLSHKDMVYILGFSYRQIDFCIRKTKKLDQLLFILQRTPIIRLPQVGTLTGGHHVSEYGRSTIKSPGKPEASLPGQSKCPACGMVVNGNDVRCRCD